MYKSLILVLQLLLNKKETACTIYIFCNIYKFIPYYSNIVLLVNKAISHCCNVFFPNELIIIPFRIINNLTYFTVVSTAGERHTNQARNSLQEELLHACDWVRNWLMFIIISETVILIYRLITICRISSLAQSQHYDQEGVTDIYRQYGDHLYSKGDHDGAIAQYIKTIGKLEASYVIRKVCIYALK